MNVPLLIHAIVRQTTVLIAQLATTGGVRAPVAHLANQVFLDLAREFESQGVSRKVSADMFGMALRAYLRKIQRLTESSTEQGRSLWEAVYDFLRSHDVVTRREIIERFRRDDESQVRSVLHDLAESGFVFQTGTQQDAVFRAATDQELGRMRQLKDGRIDELVWAIVYRDGPITREALGRIEGFRGADLDAALERLVEAGRVACDEHLEGKRYRAHRLVVPIGSEIGWEAAVFDHFHAMVTTIGRKLTRSRKSSADDDIGGSTYTFEVWPGHPMEGEVRGSLARFRKEHSEIRTRLRAFNDEREAPGSAYQVVVYGGQYVVEDEEDA
jgi:hypothetical protein